MKYSFILVLTLFLSPVSKAEENHAFDVNDVSFLLPIQDELPYPNVELESDLQFPQIYFEQILKFENPDLSIDRLPYLDGKYLGSRSNWYLTAMRFDPCGEVFQIEKIQDPFNKKQILRARRGPGCQPRLRLVVQPFNLFGKPVATALHLLLKLDSNQTLDLISDLQKIKSLAEQKLSISTSGYPLMLHPALLAESKSQNNGEVAAAVKKTISRIPMSQLEIVTMSLQVELDHWRFVGGIIHETKWQRFVTDFSFNLYKDQNHVQAGIGIEDFDCNGISICALSPTTPQKIDKIVSYIFQADSVFRNEQVPGHRSDDTKVRSEIIDNPGQTHFFNTNCISCHASSNLRDVENLHTQFQFPNGPTPFVPRKFLTGLTNNIINFGYWGVTPRISQRTASESVMVADWVNKKLQLKSERHLDLASFWKCLTNEENFLTCFK